MLGIKTSNRGRNPLDWIFFCSKIQIPVGATHEKNINFSKPGFERRPKNLYVTTASILNSLQHNDTLQFLEVNFPERKNSDKEIWLLGVDIEVENDQVNRSVLLKIS